MSRYTEQHYEDVAKALKENRDWALRLDNVHARGVMASTIGTFADLFAADNPKRCTFHGEHDTGYSEDCKITGFNREQFLAACGLESTQPDPRCEVGSHDGPCTSACVPERRD